jgi:asparagine synthase (glutamine-hydrolysing)
MCGIFALINNTHDDELIRTAFNKGKHRGPETSSIIKATVDSKIIFGFNRLSINGYNDSNSNQPLVYNDCALICNGEIYNYKQLYHEMGIKGNTKSDCEVIIHCYTKYGILHTLQLLDGVYSFVLMDYKRNVIYIARDTYGVRPMFIGQYKDSDNNNHYAFTSVMKQIVKLDTDDNKYFIKQFLPGHLVKFSKNTEHTSYVMSQYQKFSCANSFTNLTIRRDVDIYSLIRSTLEFAVKKRVYNCDRDIACLLSGGLDSSLIAALVSKYYKQKFPNRKLHTWSIGLPGSLDLMYAEKVAKHIGTHHHSIVVNEEELIDSIDKVIYHIESYDTTSVRASVPNWLISKHIKEFETHVDAKVIFNGDGSDEVTGGYLYFHYIKDPLLFDKECRRLLSNIHLFDVLRSDRSIASHGLEARTPFLDRNFVQSYLSIDPRTRCHTSKNLCEKFLLRSAFDDGELLPKEVLWRTKEAFSDGVSTQENSWHNIIKTYVKNKIFVGDNFPDNDKDIIDSLVKKHNLEHNKPTTLEQLFYRLIFEKYFPNKSNTIPYFWMPKYVSASDASARSLQIYNIRNQKQ